MKNISKKIISLTVSIFILSFYSVYPVLASEINVPTVIKLVNDARSSQGIANLSENEKLDKIAGDKLADMMKNDYFAHTSPQGISPWYWYEKNNYDYKYAGENLAINFLSSEDQQKAWMDSPTHRKNILNPNYQEIGVAVAAGEINNQTAIITVQEFGALAGEGVYSGEKSFSSSPKGSSIKDGVKIEPQVLSVKDMTGENLINNNANGAKNWFRDMAEGFNKNKPAVAYYSWILALVLMYISILFASLSFMTIGVHNIWDAYELKQKDLTDGIAEKIASASRHKALS